MMKEIIYLLFVITLLSCVDHSDFNTPNSNCQENQIKPNSTFGDIKALYKDEIIKIREDLVIEGYIVSNDQAGNFFGSLHIQDNFINPTEGFQIDVDIRDSHLFYKEGKKVYVKLQGLYLGKSNDVFKVGGVFKNAGGTLSVGRMPTIKVKEHVMNSCDELETIIPKNIFIDELNDDMLNTLIQINNVEVDDENLLQPYAVVEETTDRILKDCNGNSIILRNSGYSDFQSEILPNGNGAIVGVLGKYRNKYQLTIRDLEDVHFSNDRCNSIANAKLITINSMKNIYTNNDLVIDKNIKIKAVVTSDRTTQNLELQKAIIQDETAGIELNFTFNHSLNLGDEVEIVLLETHLEKVTGSLQLSNITAENIISVNQGVLPIPKDITIEEVLSGNYEGELVQINNVQFLETEQIYNGTQTIMNCESNLKAIIRPEALFANENVNTQNGTITGIIRFNETPSIYIRNLDDVNFTDEYIDCYANDTFVFISEISDPENNAGARFVELYNSSNEEINLTGWELRRYTNANINYTTTIDLSGYSIGAKSTFVIAANAIEFETVYSFTPDFEAGTGGAADSNGDDNLELVNSIETVIDVFGVPGEDGSGTNHEFEDGRAIRNLEVLNGNSIYTFNEWTVYNDTGNSGTINLPQQAPNDFTPGLR